jgi:hypothetical protein
MRKRAGRWLGGVGRASEQARSKGAAIVMWITTTGLRRRRLLLLLVIIVWRSVSWKARM